jgi:uncharacterized protein YecT (DUF1311 family)
MNACASDKANRVDEELNRTYTVLLTKFNDNPTAGAKIRAAERAWLRYRDAYMDAMYPAKDKQTEYGSIYPMEFNLLVAKITRTQILALRDVLRKNDPH